MKLSRSMCWVLLQAISLLPAAVCGQVGGSPDHVPDFQTLPQAMELPPQDRGVPMTAVQFRGVTAFSEDELRDLIAEQLGGIRRGGLTAARADDTAFFIAIHYRKAGYSQVVVDEQITRDGRLILNVREGPVTAVREVRFIGNEYIEDETLREYLLGATIERQGDREPVPFVEGDIITGIERIRGLYLSEGFLQSDIPEPEIQISPAGASAVINVRIHEGMRYIIGPIEITGDLVFFPQDELQEQLSSYRGQPYTPTRVSNLRRSIVYFYKSRGYFETAVETTVDPLESEDGSVPVAFHVSSGELYRFDGVEVSGVDRLDENFLKKRFGILEGEIYSPEKVDRIFRDMMQTGLFEQLNVRSEPLETNEIKLHISVEEARAREVGFSMGYGTYEGPFVGASAADRNLFGTGRLLRGDVEIAQRYLRGEIVYRDRWLFDTPYEFEFRLHALSTDFDGYSKAERGARVSLARELAENLRARLFVRGREVSITSTGIDPFYLGPTGYMVNSVGMSLELDHRNSILNPRRGWIFTTAVEYATAALGSDVEFVRNTYRFSYYLPMGKFLLALGARGGVVSGGDMLPIDERFFNGGSRSVRSFAERELGPKDESGHPVGGAAYSVYNAEFIFPIAGELEGAVFFDAGSVHDSPGRGLDGMRYAVGVGLRYNLPIGPIRLDYGVNPSPAADEAPGAFHFSFGFAF